MTTTLQEFVTLKTNKPDEVWQKEKYAARQIYTNKEGERSRYCLRINRSEDEFVNSLSQQMDKLRAVLDKFISHFKTYSVPTESVAPDSDKSQRKQPVQKQPKIVSRKRCPRITSIKSSKSCHGSDVRASQITGMKVVNSEKAQLVTDVLAGENPVSLKQQEDKEIGLIVRLKLAGSETPTEQDLVTQSKKTRLLCKQWDLLVVRQEVVYRLYCGKGGRQRLQLLVPNSLRAEVLEMCHMKADGSHRGLRSTMDEVQHLFFWSTWMDDTASFCRKCSECRSSQCNELPRLVSQKPIVANTSDGEPTSLLYTSQETEQSQVDLGETTAENGASAEHARMSPAQLSVEPILSDSDSGYSGPERRNLSQALGAGRKRLRRSKRQRSRLPAETTN